MSHPFWQYHHNMEINVTNNRHFVFVYLLGKLDYSLYSQRNDNRLYIVCNIYFTVEFIQKEKMKIGKNTAKLIVLWYDNFGKNQASLQRNGMAAITKTHQTVSKQKLLLKVELYNIQMCTVSVEIKSLIMRFIKHSIV